MTDALAEWTRRRPRRLIGGAIAALLVFLAVGWGASSHLAVGSEELTDSAPGPTFQLVTTGSIPVSSRVYQVALQTISSQLRANPKVETIARGPVSKDGVTTAIEVTLRTSDPADQQSQAKAVLASIDPGPLRVVLGGQTAVAIDAQHDLSDQLPKLMFLALPFCLLVLWWLLGLRLGLGAILSAAIAIAGVLAVLRVAGLVFNVSLLGVAPGALVALVLGVELSALIAARYRDEAQLAPHEAALSRAVAYGLRKCAVAGAGTAAAVVGLLATPLDQSGSIVFGCVVGAVLAALAAVVVVPAIIGLERRPRLYDDTRIAETSRLAAGWLVGRTVRLAIVCVVAGAVLVALTVPATSGTSRPLEARDLPAKASARQASEALAPGQGDGAASAAGGNSLFGKLPLAAAVSLAATALLLAAVLRSPRGALAAVPALLPAAAACGLAVLVFQEGHGASALGQHRQDAIATGALAGLLVTLAAVGVVRTLAEARLVRREQSFGLGVERATQQAAALTMPALVAATLVAAAAVGVLGGSHLYPAREFGLAVAAGLVLDLVLVRVPLIAVLGRHFPGPAGPGA